MSAQRAARIGTLGFEPSVEERELVAECNLCGSANHVEVARTDRYGYPQPFRVCVRCGLGFLSPRLTALAYAAFYGNVYRPLVSAYHGRLIDAETVQAEQGEYAQELMGFLRHTLPAPPATVLDVGGSTGIVAGAVRDAFGSAATVLDPAPDELAVAEAAGMETIAGFAEDVDYGGRTFDLVLLCQTIDHLLDIAATLSAIRKALAPEGRAFVDVLDVGFMARRRGSIEGAVKVDHPYYLTRATALAYFRASGLEPVAERMSEDGHWGFLLAPGEPAEPDWAALSASREALLAELWRLRAES
ncbi:MAG: methyltransferase domain-containing protein [Gaiellaceae bacterium]